MSGKRKKKKKRVKYGNIILSFLTLALLGFLIYYGVQTVFFTNSDTYSAEYKKYEVTSTHDAIVVRNEIIIKSAIGGSSEYYVEEGERVRRDEPVVKVTKSEDLMTAKESSTEPVAQAVLMDTAVISDRVDALKTSILFEIREGNYGNIKALSDQLYIEISDLHRAQMEMATKNVNEVVVQGSSQMPVQTYNAPAAGIVSYSSDGYEEVLSYNNINNLDFNAIFATPMNQVAMNKGSINSGETIFKIIDNTKCYLLMKIESDEVAIFSALSKLEITINNAKYDADVMEVTPISSGGIVVLRMASVFDEFTKTRTLNVTAKISDYQGVKLNKSSLIKVDGVLGVYTVDIKRLIRFTPIKVLSEQNDSVIVYHENFYDESGAVVNTVSVQDEIINNPVGFKPGSYLP